MKHSALIAILAMAATLSACGGGGGSSPTEPRDDAQTPQTQSQPTAMHRPTLKRIAAPVSLADVQHYVREGLNNDYIEAPSLNQWTAPPTIRISTNTPSAQRRTIARAIHGINAHLPTHWHLTIGADMPRINSASEVPDGVIFVDHSELADSAAWSRTRGSQEHALGLASNNERDGVIVASAVFASIDPVDNPFNSAVDDDLDMHVMQHELLHALGLGVHLNDATWQDGTWLESRLGLVAPQLGHATISSPFASLELPRIDGAALYHTTFGRWSDSAMRIEGQWDGNPPLTVALGSEYVTEGFETPAAYGVDWQNGFAIPWTEGHIGPSAPAVSRGTWNGGVVGITPDGRAVTGNSEITVNFGANNGSIDLDDLEYADRSRWGDGDLDYRIAIHGHHFARSGGDRGSLHGRFVGNDNSGAVGTLERSDLTAAFGGSR